MWYFTLQNHFLLVFYLVPYRTQKPLQKNKIKPFMCVLFKGLKKTRGEASFCIMGPSQNHRRGPLLCCVCKISWTGLVFFPVSYVSQG